MSRWVVRGKLSCPFRALTSKLQCLLLCLACLRCQPGAAGAGTGKETGDRHPKVSDNVLIGACATVLGNIAINKGAQARPPCAHPA